MLLVSAGNIWVLGRDARFWSANGMGLRSSAYAFVGVSVFIVSLLIIVSTNVTRFRDVVCSLQCFSSTLCTSHSSVMLKMCFRQADASNPRIGGKVNGERHCKCSSPNVDAGRGLKL